MKYHELPIEELKEHRPIEGLTANEDQLLNVACKIAFNQGHTAIWNLQGGPPAWSHALRRLESHKYIQSHEWGPGFYVTDLGLKRYIDSGAIPEYIKHVADVGRLLYKTVTVTGSSFEHDIDPLLGRREVSNVYVELHTGMPVLLVECIFRSLAGEGKIKYREQVGSSIGNGLIMNVYWVSPSLRGAMNHSEGCKHEPAILHGDRRPICRKCGATQSSYGQRSLLCSGNELG